MLRLFRYLKGYILICAQGGFPERFLNLCKNNGIILWNVKINGVKVWAFTYSSELEQLKIAGENSGMEIVVNSEKGMKTLINQHKWRVGVVAGIAIIALFFSYMSNFIWEIEIVANNTVKFIDFTDVLTSYGIKKGVRKDNVDIVKTERSLKSRYAEILSVDINIFGSKLQVLINGAETEAESLNHEKPYNVVARKNGKITLIKGYYGENMVKEGDYVAEGSLLISGISAYSDGSEHKFHAKGQVFARTENVIKCKQRLYENWQVINESNRRYLFYFFGLEIPLGRYFKGGESQKNYMFLGSKNGDLPIGLVREDCFFTDEREIVFSHEEGLLLSLLDYTEKKRGDFDDAQFEKIEMTEKFKDNSVILTSKIICVEDIAEEKLLEVFENPPKNEEN